MDRYSRVMLTLIAVALFLNLVLSAMSMGSPIGVAHAQMNPTRVIVVGWDLPKPTAFAPTPSLPVHVVGVTTPDTLRVHVRNDEPIPVAIKSEKTK